MSILIADDEPVSRRLLESTLVRFGHDVVAVTNGEEAVDTILKPEGPRLAILDWDMPGLDGPAACREIRKRSSTYVYMMLLTARDRQEDLVYGFDAEVDDFLTKPFNAIELRARVHSGERVLALQENLLRAQEALRHQATHDCLTGLFNRAMVLEHLQFECHRARRNGGPLSIAIADVDHFKRINDTFGHVIGDVVLKYVAESMRSVARGCECLARYGGEEFLLVMPGCDEAGAVVAAERARAAVGASGVQVGGHTVGVNVSVGIASTATAGDNPEALILAADEAMYFAKARGRNRVERCVRKPIYSILEPQTIQ